MCLMAVAEDVATSKNAKELILPCLASQAESEILQVA